MNGSRLVAAAALCLAALATPVRAQCTGMPDGTPCDDGLFCNGSDSCQSGVCTGTGDPCDGPDFDANCSESCDEVADNCTADDPWFSPCDDGRACTLDDACEAGRCTSQTNAPDGTPCDDGLFCNGSDSCQSGVCRRTGDPCDGPDGDADCSESCDEVADTCTSPDPAITLWAVSVTATRTGEFPTEVELAWEATCTLAPDYAVYEGVPEDFTGHLPVVCTTGGATSTTVIPGDGDRYFLVVPQDPSSGIEGSYGFASDGTPREPSLSACEAATVCDCP